MAEPREQYTAHLVGQPVRGDDQAEFVFEVRSSSAFRRPWRIQRRMRTVRRLHSALLAEWGEEFPLPVPPGPRGWLQHIVGGLRSRREEQFLEETGRAVEGYLNALLAIPGVRDSPEVLTFIDAPIGSPEEDQRSRFCSICRLICKALQRLLGGGECPRQPLDPAIEEEQTHQEALRRRQEQIRLRYSSAMRKRGNRRSCPTGDLEDLPPKGLTFHAVREVPACNVKPRCSSS